MKLNDWLRLMAGIVVLTGIALSIWVSPWWILLAAFAAINQIQSAFTKWCPAMTFLRKCGVSS